MGGTQTQPVSITLKIYDILGQLVRALVDEETFAGTHQIFWDGRADGGRGLGSGIYLCRLKVGDQTVTKRMLLLK